MSKVKGRITKVEKKGKVNKAAVVTYDGMPDAEREAMIAVAREKAHEIVEKHYTKEEMDNILKEAEEMVHKEKMRRKTEGAKHAAKVFTEEERIREEISAIADLYSRLEIISDQCYEVNERWTRCASEPYPKKEADWLLRVYEHVNEILMMLEDREYELFSKGKEE